MAAKSARRTTPQPPREPKTKRGHGDRLTFADRYRLLETHRANPTWTWQQLGDATGTSHETARLTCLAAGKSAADLMSAYAAPMLALWRKAATIAAARGDHRPTKEWLLHAGSIDPIPESQRTAGPSIVIVNTSMPGMPAGQTITIEPVNHDAPKALPDDQR